MPTAVQVDPSNVRAYSTETHYILNRYLNPELTAAGEERLELAQKELLMFRAGTNLCAAAIKDARTALPHVWWRTWGDTYPVLAPMACKLLSKQPSASPCERNWSSLDVVLGKRRCSMLSSTLSKLLRVRQHMHNLRQQRAAALATDPYADLLWQLVTTDGDDFMVPLEDEAEMLEDAADAAGVEAWCASVLAELGM